MSQSLIERHRKHMREPVFALRVAGATHNVVASPSMAETALVSPTASSTGLLNLTLERVFGDRGAMCRLTAAELSHFYHKLPSLFMQEPFVSEASTSAVRLIEREVPNLVSFCRSVVDQTAWERNSNVVVNEESDTPTCEADLFALIRNFVGHVTMTIFMGRAFVDAFPGLLDDLWCLDEQAVYLSMGVPRWLPLPGMSGAYAARDRLLSALAVFHRAFAAWDDGRDPGPEFRDLDDVSEPVKQRVRFLRDKGLSAAASAPAHLSLLWSMNANLATIVAWNIFRAMATPDVHDQIEEEISLYARAFRPSREETGFPIQDPPKLSIDLDGLLRSCPLLRSCYYETLRIDSAAISIRELTDDLTLIDTRDGDEEDSHAIAEDRGCLSKFTLPRGDRLVVPHGVIQNDGHYFSNPASYDLTRFIVTEGENGPKKAYMHTMKPFGMGVSACKGQVFAERAAIAFTAAILSMWDIQPVAETGWTAPPRKYATAALLPAKDIRVRFKQRV